MSDSDLIMWAILWAIPIAVLVFGRLEHRRCRFCGGRKALLLAPAVWEYTRDRYYHTECLTAVLRDPERHGNAAVDLAIDIEERIAYLKKGREEKIGRARRAAERL